MSELIRLRSAYRDTLEALPEIIGATRSAPVPVALVCAGVFGVLGLAVVAAAVVALALVAACTAVGLGVGVLAAVARLGSARRGPGESVTVITVPESK